MFAQFTKINQNRDSNCLFLYLLTSLTDVGFGKPALVSIPVFLPEQDAIFNTIRVIWLASCPVEKVHCKAKDLPSDLCEKEKYKAQSNPRPYIVQQQTLKNHKSVKSTFDEFLVILFQSPGDPSVHSKFPSVVRSFAPIHTTSLKTQFVRFLKRSIIVLSEKIHCPNCIQK